MRKFTQKLLFRLYDYFSLVRGGLALLPYRIAGLKVGYMSKVDRPRFTWPHQVVIGKYCLIEKGAFFKYVGIWAPGPSILLADHVFLGSQVEMNIRHHLHIGKGSMIASGCKFIDHDHGTARHDLPIRLQPPSGAGIVLEEESWLGFNVVVLKGVTIGEGAVVAAGAVVTQSIPPFEIWGGIPAKKIGIRK
ncbi:MAG: acyltransferase [Bacteroidota bacterium]